MSVWGISYSTIRQLGYYNKGENMSKLDVEEARRHTLGLMDRITDSIEVTCEEVDVGGGSIEVDMIGRVQLYQAMWITKECIENESEEQRKKTLSIPIFHSIYGPMAEQLRRIGTNLVISKDIDECKDAIFQLVADLKWRNRGSK